MVDCHLPSINKTNNLNNLYIYNSILQDWMQLKLPHLSYDYYVMWLQYFDNQDLQCVMEVPSTVWDEIIHKAGLYSTGMVWPHSVNKSSDLTSLR